PKNVEISEEGLLTWDAVSGADYYIVYIDQRMIEVHEGTSLDLTTQNILVGERLVSVVTVKGEGQSLPSAVVNYTVVQLSDPEVVTEGVLEILNPKYTSADMVRDDFDFDWEYDEYLDMLRMTEAYAEAVTSINMTEANALGFFGALDDMMNAEQGPENLSALMEEMEMLDTYNVDAYTAATIIYHLLVVSLEMQVEQVQAQMVDNDDAQLEEMLEALQANEVIAIQSLTIVLDFLLTFKDSLSTNVIGLLDDAIEGQELSINEIIIIKDEVVGILQDTMPSVSDFTFLYSSLMTISGTMTGQDMSGYLPHADFLAEVDHLAITIGLEFIASVNTQTVEDIQALVEAIESGMYGPDPEKVIDLVLYVMTYISDFKDANAELFADYDELMQDEALEALFGLAIDQIIFQVENDPYMGEEADMVVAMLEAYKDEYDTIRATMDIFATIGENLFNEFVSSEAALFYAIIELQTNSMELTMEGILTQVIDDILPLFMDYHTAIFGELDQEAVLTILEFIQIPATVALTNMVMMGDMPNFDAILDDVADVVANVIVLETAILNAIDDADIPAIMSNENLDPEVAAVLSMISVLDIALSSANEAIIDDIIDTIFENILKDPEIMPLLDATSQEINEMKTMVTGEVDGFITEIHEIADFNFNALTYDDMERIQAIAEMIQMIFESIGGGNVGPKEYSYIYEGQYSIYVDDVAYFIFEAETSGFYTFESLVIGYSPDPNITIYDEDMNQIGYDDDGGDYLNFDITLYINSGQYYYLEIATYDGGAYNFEISIG
ncbi:MAG: hypothetical protein RBT45_04735, partial [Acholeplasmataceae bacterium]|nr:hypothetical protein [Acholeplasmataceae bacterium]